MKQKDERCIKSKHFMDEEFAEVLIFVMKCISNNAG